MPGRVRVERLAAVLGHLGRHLQHVQPHRVVRIEVDVVVVERPVGRGIHERPGHARILGSIDAGSRHFRIRAARRFDNRRQNLSVAPEHREADLADRSGRQPAAELRPRVAAVGGLEQSTIGAAALEDVGLADPFPHACVQNVGIRGVHDQVAGPGPIVLRQTARELLPGLAAVNRLEDAALRVVAPEVSLRGDVHDVRVRWVRDDASDVMRLGESHLRERLAGIG